MHLRMRSLANLGHHPDASLLSLFSARPPVIGIGKTGFKDSTAIRLKRFLLERGTGTP
jgi:hypothetical protein